MLITDSFAAGEHFSSNYLETFAFINDPDIIAIARSKCHAFYDKGRKVERIKKVWEETAIATASSAESFKLTSKALYHVSLTFVKRR